MYIILCQVNPQKQSLCKHKKQKHQTQIFHQLVPSVLPLLKVQTQEHRASKTSSTKHSELVIQHHIAIRSNLNDAEWFTILTTNLIQDPLLINSLVSLSLHYVLCCMVHRTPHCTCRHKLYSKSTTNILTHKSLIHSNMTDVLWFTELSTEQVFKMVCIYM